MTPYTVYDMMIHGEPHFCWPMTDQPEKSRVFNAKPATLQPSGAERLWPSRWPGLWGRGS